MKQEYPNWHEVKDLVDIYGGREWDDAEIVVWNPKEQKNYRVTFCGSTRPEAGHSPNYGGDGRGKINFVLVPME